MFGGLCRCLRALTRRRALVGSWDVDLRRLLSLGFFVGFPSIFQGRMASASSCFSFLHVPLVVARARSEAHLLGTKEDPIHCLLLPAFIMSHCFTVYSRAFKPHLMQPLGSLCIAACWCSQCCGTALLHAVTVSQHYPHMTLLESPLAQGSRQSRHRAVSPAAKPGVGSRASW